MSRLSIILPTYNGARFLRPQIESILAQTDPDFDLILVDDGSTDDSVAILDEFVKRDARVRRLPSTGNIGQRGRLVELANAADGEFLAFADQDDFWEPDRNAKLLAAMGDKAVAFGRSQLVDGDGKDLGISLLDQLNIDPRAAGPLTSLFRPLVSAHAAIVRRSWFDNSVFTGPMMFDHALGLAAQLSAGLIYVDDAVVNHRIHGGNQMNSHAVTRKGTRLLSLYRLRTSTSFVLTDRLYFFMALDQMSKSPSIPLAAANACKRAATACRYTWFQPLTYTFGAARKLELELVNLLGALSNSPGDIAYFTRRIRSVARPQLSAINLARTFRQYAYQADP